MTKCPMMLWLDCSLAWSPGPPHDPHSAHYDISNDLHTSIRNGTVAPVSSQLYPVQSITSLFSAIFI
jgi:hypothetical protein